MSDPWKRKLPRMSEEMKVRMEDHTISLLEGITWKSNGTPDCLQSAIEQARNGLDGGRALTLSFMPKSHCFEDWDHWHELVSELCNRENGIRNLLAEFRQPCIKFIYIVGRVIV